MALIVLSENDPHNVTFLKLDSSFLPPLLTSMEEEQNKKEIQTVKHGFSLEGKSMSKSGAFVVSLNPKETVWVFNQTFIIVLLAFHADLQMFFIIFPTQWPSKLMTIFSGISTNNEWPLFYAVLL